MEGNKEIDGNGSEKIEDNKEVMIENNNNENNDKNLTSTQPNEEENKIEEEKKESEKNNEEENKVENNIEEGNKVENNNEEEKKLENKNKVENNNEEGNKIEENKEENNNEEDKKENKNEGENKKEENKEENNVENNIIENNIENKIEEGNKTEDNKEENNIENNKIESNKEEKNIENKTEEDNKKEDNNEEEKEKENNSKDKKEEENNNIEKKEEINKNEDKKEEKNNNIKKDEELIKEDEKKEKKVTPLTPEISPEFEEFINQKNEEELFCYDCGRKFKVDFKSSLGAFFSTFEDFEKIFQYSLNCCLPCLEKIIKKFDSSSKLRKENNIPKHETENNISEEDLEEEEKKIEKEIKLLQEEINQSEIKLKEEETKFQISIEKLKEATDEENKFLSDFRNLEKDAYILEKEKTYVENRNKLYETISKKFTYSNLLTDLFDISFDEKFGTINGCKFSDNLGNGDEVNAGWGYIAFLTKLLTIKYEFKSSNLKIYLEGNYSKMIEGNNFYELSFSSGSRTLDQFNEAMKKYLNFLKEFTNYLTGYKKISIDNDDFKFEIDGDKINGKSIIFSEQTKTFEWPECMKYLLTILKFLITKTLGEENQSYRNLVEETLIINKQQK